MCLNNAWKYLNIHTLMFLNMSEHDWILLNVPQYACKYLNKLFYARVFNMLNVWQCFEYASGISYARVLNMPQYSYNNIFVTNVIILEFLVAWFLYPGAVQLTTTNLFLTRESIRVTKANKLLINFCFWYNNVRAFEVFKCIAGCIFKCKTKMKLAETYFKT